MSNAKSVELIETFYQAFEQRDPAAMIACYAPDIRFSDPVFQDLRGPEVGNMWRMLGQGTQRIGLTFGDIDADEHTGRAHWEARYVFSLTGREVHNIIDARFELSDGKITCHTDCFDLWRWSGMALGWKGRLLGWSPLVQNAVRKTAMGRLREYERRHSE